MAATVATSAGLEQGNDVALVRELLREAIDETHSKHDAVACAMGVGSPYLSQMLAGEKPIGSKHLRALPDDVEAVFARLYAESFGLIVVVPAEGEKALTAFVSGLAGLLGAKLPARAMRMASASIPDAQRKTA